MSYATVQLKPLSLVCPEWNRNQLDSFKTLPLKADGLHTLYPHNTVSFQPPGKCINNRPNLGKKNCFLMVDQNAWLDNSIK